MTKFQLPVMLPPGAPITMTQGFGVTSNTLEPEGPHGEKHFHYGIDLTFGDAFNTYGVPLVIPFVSATFVSELQPPGSPTNTPYVVFRGVGASGNVYQLTLAHCRDILLSTKYAAGQVVAHIGNYGMVNPQPAVTAPWAGAHLHLGLQVNDSWVDPTLYFEITNPFVGPHHDPSQCLDRLQWAIAQYKA